MEFFSTPLTKPIVGDTFYTRAPESILGLIPKKITTAERIMVVYQILRRITWGTNRSEYGIAKLIKQKVLTDAFPLHDGTFKWTESGPLNDRQLLAKYWGAFKYWNKSQPLNLIEKYFGTEYALYFAWLGMYNTYLFPAAFLSILVVIYGIITTFTDLNFYSDLICNSNIKLCPRCHMQDCPMEMLNNSCYLAHVSYIFDNWCAIIFCVVISLWATIFMEMWQREESVLELQWNLKSIRHTIILRPEYLEAVKKKRYCKVTEKMVPYMPKCEQAIRYILTLVSLIILLLIMILVAVGVIIYRVSFNTILVKTKNYSLINNRYRLLVASITAAMISGTFIFIHKWIYEKATLFLNNVETHRTQKTYTDAFIFKSYALAFANNYTAVFYVALFKGKFFTYPGDLENFEHFEGIHSDICDSTGCIVDLSILLIIIMSLQAFVSNITQILIPKLTQLYNKFTNRTKVMDLPEWEEQYLLASTEEFFMVGEYMDMVIQYGFINFFIMGFPLAPLLALLNNVAELRVDASKVTKSYRRNIPVKSAGIGAWLGILQATTYIGVVINALIIAFSSTFMEQVIWQVYSGHDQNPAHYLHYTLSEFNMQDFTFYKTHSTRNFSTLNNNSQICYYVGQRYPPNHPQKYQRRKDYWFHLAIKFAAVLIFEHILMVLKGFIAYAIPDVPISVRQQIQCQEKSERRTRNVEMNQKYLKTKDEEQKKLYNIY